MTEPVEVPERSDAAAPWARLLDRHRAEWAGDLLAGWSVVDLAGASDPVQAIVDAPERTAFVWLEGYAEADRSERLRTAIAEAADREAPIVIGFEADREGRGQREAEALRSVLDDARVVTQELAAGSLIGADASDDAAANRRSVHMLVCANVQAARASAHLRAEAEPLMTGYVAWLEQANRELRKANTRLGRDRLGHHDAAAAAVIDRRLDLERRIAELEQQLEEQRGIAAARQEALVAARWDKESTLQAPRYRFVDSLRELAFSLPGVALALRLRSRRVRKNWDQS